MTAIDNSGTRTLTFDNFVEFCEEVQENCKHLSEKYDRSIKVLNYEFVPPPEYGPMKGELYKTPDGENVFPKIEVLISVGGIGEYQLGYRRNSTAHEYQPSFNCFENEHPGWVGKKYDYDHFNKLEDILKKHTEKEKNKRFIKQHVSDLGAKDLADIAEEIESRKAEL